jgi:hypothetical protein
MIGSHTCLIYPGPRTIVLPHASHSEGAVCAIGNHHKVLITDTKIISRYAG